MTQQQQSTPAQDIRRLKWACRRGMLELDVLLEPFVDREYAGLSRGEQQQFERLLTSDDPELFAWFMGHEQCPDPQLASIVKLVLERNRL
ncbi:succinate dehydrogenase assembly factor 2 [Ferrimonas lipolytica]|uniref:FAD assembly factor SdhE n=1 Tax=Ferrimonas lipolytica TaxID=2724191 RepID=A0A6H1UH16_9GAMM|nr:succinate dehydrogenase assembly factor 2 [Ferrimonas lipolytica]QIZ77506.1 succinate dehydrogenase assembly factor 2 [Ferrimonas lipolytica]